MAKEFKSPSEMAMHADKLWDALRAQTSDSFVAAAFSVASICKLTPDVASLLDEFPEAWKPHVPGKLPAHNVEHVIETEGQPLNALLRHLDQAKLALAKAEFQKMESAGYYSLL